MPDHYINCDLKQARQVAEWLAKGKGVWVEMEDQPPVEPESALDKIAKDQWERWLVAGRIISPYAVGDRLRWREPWIAFDDDTFMVYRYAADFGGKSGVIAKLLNPANVMPLDAIRLEITVGESRPEQSGGRWGWRVTRAKEWNPDDILRCESCGAPEGTNCGCDWEGAGG